MGAAVAGDVTGGLRVGIADHLGWAIAVTASPDHEVVDRRRIELVEPGVTGAPIHYESWRLDEAGTAALVAEVRASVARAASVAFDELAGAVSSPPGSLFLRAVPAGFPTAIDVLRRAPYESRADAVMYRQILGDLARARGWAVHHYDARTIEAEAVARLGPRADDVLHGPRLRLGAPWAKDHRVALSATVVGG